MKEKKVLRALSLLLIVALAGAMFVSGVSADSQISNEERITMKYFKDVPIRDNIVSQPESIFNTLSEYSTVTVDAEAFINDADLNKKVGFSLNNKDYTIVLTEVESPIDSNAKLMIKSPEGKIVTEIPLIKTYHGDLLGDKTGDALFTVSDNVLIGRIKLGNKTYCIDQCGIGDDGKIIHILYDTAKTIKRGNPRPFDIVIRDEDSENINGIDISNQVNQNGILSSSNVGLLAVYNPEFQNTYPNPTAEISNMISQVNTAFSPADVTLTITDYYQDSVLSGSLAYPLLCDFRVEYQDERDSTNSDLAFLFTGKQLGNSVGGSFHYSNGNPANAYALAQMVSDGGIFSGSLHHRCVLTTHEIGHNFGADHEDSTSSPTWARAFHWVEWWIFDKYTAMWSLWQGDDAQIEFSNSNNHGDSTHNNIQRIRDTRTTVAGYQ